MTTRLQRSTRQRLLLLALGLAAVGAQAGPSSAAEPAAPGLVDPATASKEPTDDTMRNWRSRYAGYYKRNWGVDIVGVRPVSSGYMLAFRYRVLDPVKAKVLNDRKSKAYLRDDATGTVLAVPAMENVGELRSGTTPEADRTYFMIFGNPGKLVKPGSRVSVVAGDLHIDGMVVE
jgi:hypothetical protein